MKRHRLYRTNQPLKMSATVGGDMKWPPVRSGYLYEVLSTKRLYTSAGSQHNQGSHAVEREYALSHWYTLYTVE